MTHRETRDEPSASRAKPHIHYASIDTIQIRLRDEYRTHMKRIREHQTLFVKLRSGRTWGYGEAYTMEPERCLEEIRSVNLQGRGLWDSEGWTDQVTQRPARAALDLAFHDLRAKVLGLTLREYLGLPSRSVPTAVSIGLQEEERVIEQARHWTSLGYSLLKIKVGRETDPRLLHAVRRAVGDGVGLWVDANQGWDVELALRILPILEESGVLFVEQPFPIGRFAECATLRQHTRIPIYLDEDITGVEDVVRANRAGGVDGVNVKLSKCGGIRESLRCITVARALGMKVLLGCFFESSLAITAASHLQGLADFVDLDACLHLDSTPPFSGGVYDPPYFRSPIEPGIGAKPH